MDRDSRRVRQDVLDELRRSIGFDWYAFVLTDPQTSVGCAPLAEVPVLQELPKVIRLKYLTTYNRWTTLDGPARLDTPQESLLWREVLAGQGVRDVASVVFRDAFGCWGFLDLWRSTVFTAAEMTRLGKIVEPVTTALRRCQAATFDTKPVAAERSPLVLLLSPELTVQGQTPATHEYLRVLVPPDGERPPIPASAYNVAAQLLAVEAGVDVHPPRARVYLADGQWLTLRAARMNEGGTIAVTIEQASPGERLDLFARASGLTPREAELLGYLAEGTDTKDVSRRMHLSEYTIQDHLKAIFAKTGTHSRRTLLSRAVG